MSEAPIDIPLEKKSKPKSRFSWKRVISYTVITVFLIINAWILFQLWYKIEVSRIPDTVTIDFQNKSGAARLRSSFVDVLVASEGAVKKGNGYMLTMTIINPSSVTLQNLTSRFSYRSTASDTVCSELETKIQPGNSKKINCFISDLTDAELKSIGVSVFFEQIRFR